MAEYKILAKGAVDGANAGKANMQLVKAGSAFKRVEQTGLRILRGEDPIPRNLTELTSLLGDNVFGKTPDKFDYLSRFGTPVRNYIRINGGSYDVLDGSGKLSKRNYQGTFLDSAIIEVRLPKNIVFTAINGMNGTRKEYVSNGDYEISLSGEIASDHPDIYPLEQVQLLRDIVNSPEPLSVICPHLQTFGINTLVVKDVDFPQQRGFYNVQRFSISASSHAPQDIFIEELVKQEEAAKSRLGGIIDDVDGKYQEMYQRIEEALKRVPTANGTQP